MSVYRVCMLMLLSCWPVLKWQQHRSNRHKSAQTTKQKMHATCIQIMEGIYFAATMIRSWHSTCRNAEDGLNLYLCSRVEDCAEKKSPKKKSCIKKLPQSFSCPVCLEGLTFRNPAPEQQVMSTQCGHLFCYSCIVATLNERKECPMCCREQTIQNIHPVYV